MKSLDDLFNSRKTQINYSDGQKQALLKIYKFLISNDNFFLLAGYSGCGKTTIAENIANFTGCDLLAPTNAAVNRLREKIDNSKLNYKTIHSKLFSATDENNNFLANKTFSKNSIYIVDECSMVDKYVLDIMIFQAVKHNCKLIFIGDSFQLEPVGENPNIFNWEKVNPSVFKLENKYELTEVKRYDGSLLKIATEMRINKKSEFKLEVESDLLIVKKFSSALAKDIIKNNNYVVLTSTNERRMLYNKKIRSYLFAETKISNYVKNNDVLVSVSNSGNYANGEIFIIKNAKLLSEFTIFVEGKKNKTLKLNILLYRHEGELTVLIPELAESSIHGKQLLSGITNSKNIIDKNVFEVLINKKFYYGKLSMHFNRAVNIATYGYAISCHKAQGQEWDNVYIDPDFLMPVWDNAKWFYTAITRAKNKVEIIKNSYLTIN